MPDPPPVHDQVGAPVEVVPPAQVRAVETSPSGPLLPPAASVRPPNAPRPAPRKQVTPVVMDLARSPDTVGQQHADLAQGSVGDGEHSLAASAQGWIDRDTATPSWRPILATTEELTEWEIETYLGVVSAEVGIESRGADLHRLGDTLATGREIANQGLINAAIDRGAHAVVGVRMQYTPVGERLLITLSGTAVTLRDRA